MRHREFGEESRRGGNIPGRVNGVGGEDGSRWRRRQGDADKWFSSTAPALRSAPLWLHHSSHSPPFPPSHHNLALNAFIKVKIFGRKIKEWRQWSGGPRFVQITWVASVLTSGLGSRGPETPSNNPPFPHHIFPATASPAHHGDHHAAAGRLGGGVVLADTKMFKLRFPNVAQLYKDVMKAVKKK